MRQLPGNRVPRGALAAAAPATALQVLDAAPLSQNEQISVQSRYDPPPADSAWNQQPGTIAWSQPLAAGATARFGASHTIRYAKDLRLQERR